MNRRAESNYALSYAVEWANSVGLPVLFYEGLTCSYPDANDRFHTFILQGVAETALRLEELGIGYVFYLRRRHSDANNVFYRLASQAAAVVTDDYPVFVAAEHNARIGVKLDVACRAVDASCVVPMKSITTRQYAAYTIRPKIHKVLPDYLFPIPEIQVMHRWKGEPSEFHQPVCDADVPNLVASCEIDHSVPPSIDCSGGRRAALARLTNFVVNNLSRYPTQRNEPSAECTSGISPYLHFGHISSLEVALAAKSCPEFLEELIVRRELAFNFARYTENPTSIECLPDWAKITLRKHAGDKRKPVYSHEQFEAAATHDELWNATQTEMRRRGTIHGYYRMYWGKKILEWSRTPQDAVDTMVAIHNRWALDGRDPNTYTNILWCLGLHDRPWQERPIFGMVRYMSLDGMKRKTDVDAYLQRWGSRLL